MVLPPKSRTDVFRRLIYSRWFYALLASACLLNVASEIVDLLGLSDSHVLDWVSLIASTVAAVLALSVLIDLQVRRTRP